MTDKIREAEQRVIEAARKWAEWYDEDPGKGSKIEGDLMHALGDLNYPDPVAQPIDDEDNPICEVAHKPDVLFSTSALRQRVEAMEHQVAALHKDVGLMRAKIAEIEAKQATPTTAPHAAGDASTRADLVSSDGGARSPAGQTGSSATPTADDEDWVREIASQEDDIRFRAIRDLHNDVRRLESRSYASNDRLDALEAKQATPKLLDVPAACPQCQWAGALRHLDKHMERFHMESFATESTEGARGVTRTPTAKGLRAAILDRWYARAPEDYDLLSDTGLKGLEEAIEDILLETGVVRSVVLEEPRP